MRRVKLGVKENQWFRFILNPGIDWSFSVQSTGNLDFWVIFERFRPSYCVVETLHALESYGNPNSTTLDQKNSETRN